MTINFGGYNVRLSIIFNEVIFWQAEFSHLISFGDEDFFRIEAVEIDKADGEKLIASIK